MLRLFSTAVVAQGLISGANFAVGLFLIRFAPDPEYGYYVLAFSSMQLLSSAQAAWVAGPLTVLSARETAERARQMVGSVELAHRQLLRWIAPALSVLPVAGAWIGLWPMHHALIGTAAVVAGWMTLRRELMRTCHMIYARPHSVMRADAAYAGALAALSLCAATLTSAPALFATLSLATAAAVGAFVGRRSFARATGWCSQPKDAVWREMRPLAIWSLLGAVTYWVYSQSYNFILATTLNVEAVAHVNAARLMLMPIVLLMVGVGSLLVPQSARWFNNEGIGVMVRRLWAFLGGLMLLAAIYVGVLWNLRHWIVDDVMHKPIPELDLLLVMWTVQLLLSMARDVFQAGLAAMGHFRSMAWVTGAATVVSLAATWYGISTYGEVGALVGTISGELVSLLGVGAMLLRHGLAARAATGAQP